MNERYDHIWEKWDDQTIKGQIEAHKKDRSVYLDCLRKYVRDKEGAKALEVGCGSSIDSHIIAEETKAEMFGIDISEKAVEVARELDKFFDHGVVVKQGDALKLDFPDNLFDVVFSQGLLEHMPDPLAALREQLRVVRHGGVLIINVPQKYTAYTLYKHFLSCLGKWEWGLETEFSDRQLKIFGDVLGLKFLEKCGYDYWRSPFEIVFVLRTLDKKAEKIPFAKNCPVHKTISRFWEKIWMRLERTYGHLFMKNIVYVYRKP
ncbi:MAG: class I SAM-dependent methyltransferase [Candidatus Omnitrophica bacterium]|nr:class I SAM-dependent methyltransferase [Candidatus Omnitrophota bacterium]